jgi:hypothetical protein
MLRVTPNVALRIIQTFSVFQKIDNKNKESVPNTNKEDGISSYIVTISSLYL